MISKWLGARTWVGVRIVRLGEAGRATAVAVECRPGNTLVVQQAVSSWGQWTNSPLPCVWHRYEMAALIRTRSRLLWNITQKYLLQDVFDRSPL